MSVTYLTALPSAFSRSSLERHRRSPVTAPPLLGGCPSSGPAPSPWWPPVVWPRPVPAPSPPHLRLRLLPARPRESFEGGHRSHLGRPRESSTPAWIGCPPLGSAASDLGNRSPLLGSVAPAWIGHLRPWELVAPDRLDHCRAVVGRHCWDPGKNRLSSVRSVN
jgi:hypothetical protein